MLGNHLEISDIFFADPIRGGKEKVERKLFKRPPNPSSHEIPKDHHALLPFLQEARRAQDQCGEEKSGIKLDLRIEGSRSKTRLSPWRGKQRALFKACSHQV